MSFILDQSLSQTAASVNDIHQIIDNPVLQAQNNIQIPQTDICINHNNFFAQHSQTCSDIGDSCGFSYSAFAGSNHNDFTHSYNFLPEKISILLVFSCMVVSVIRSITGITCRNTGKNRLFIS